MSLLLSVEPSEDPLQPADVENRDHNSEGGDGEIINSPEKSPPPSQETENKTTTATTQEENETKQSDDKIDDLEKQATLLDSVKLHSAFATQAVEKCTNGELNEKLNTTL